MKIKKVLTILGLALFASWGIAAPAIAADNPRLTWQRGVSHTVQISTNLTPKVSHVDLLGQGKTYSFAPYTVANDLLVFKVDLPSKAPLGEYAVRLFMLNGTSQELSSIKVVEYQSGAYNPLTDVKTIASLSLTLFTLLGLWTSGSDSMERRKEEEYSEDQTTYSSADLAAFARDESKVTDYHKGLVTSIALDQWRNDAAIRSARFSPMLSRLIADSGYLQFSLGSLVLFFPAFGLLLGAIAFHDISGFGYITTPSLSISVALIVLGALDAGSAFLAAATFGVLAATNHFFTSAYDLRTLIGLTFLWFTPALVANAVRPLRRSARDENGWERLTDIAVGPLGTTWAIYNMVKGLNGFAHLNLPLANHALTCAVAGGAAIFIRYLIEEYVLRRNEHYLAFLSPKRVNEQSSLGKWLAFYFKSALFLFLAISFLGPTWHLWVALGLYILPMGIKVIQKNLPNSPLLFQLVPVGIPFVIFMWSVNRLYSQWVTGYTQDLATQSRLIFLFMAVPGILITTLKAFGRSPKEGDRRWYLRDTNKVLYRTTGPLLLLLAVGLTVGVIG
jgi:hypothetical protein